MRFVVRGVEVELDHEDVVRAVFGVQPGAVQKYGVRIGETVFPVKQAYQLASGLPRGLFTSEVARRHLRLLGFEILGPEIGGLRPAVSPEPDIQSPPDTTTDHGWRLTSMADRASREHGVDVVARKGGRRLGAEVKGWPSTGYSDVRRAAETKKTRPTTQAAHWYSRAPLNAVMLLDSHPGHEALAVLPDLGSLDRHAKPGRHRCGFDQ